MRRPNAGMRIVFNERDSVESLQDERSQQSEKKKPLLLKELENILKKLDQINEQNFQDSQDPYLNDPILQDLQNLAKDAAKHELKQIEKLCKLAMGKRILNIELKKKKDELLNKMKKRENVELFFRQNRIKRYNYDELIDNKLSHNTLIARAYPNGKGFAQSLAGYQQEYSQSLAQSDYLNVIKDVNKIFYRNYSSLSSGPLTLTDFLLSIVWIPIAIFICLAVTLPFMSFENEQIMLMVLLGIILLILFYVSVKTFLDKPSNKNFIEQSVEDVGRYFQKLNQQKMERGKNIEWSCDSEFMYLQVIFHDGFP